MLVMQVTPPHMICVCIVTRVCLFVHTHITHKLYVKIKVSVLTPAQQQGPYWDRSSVLSLVGLERHTDVAACD